MVYDHLDGLWRVLLWLWEVNFLWSLKWRLECLSFWILVWCLIHWLIVLSLVQIFHHWLWCSVLLWYCSQRWIFPVLLWLLECLELASICWLYIWWFWRDRCSRYWCYTIICFYPPRYCPSFVFITSLWYCLYFSLTDIIYEYLYVSFGLNILE